MKTANKENNAGWAERSGNMVDGLIRKEKHLFFKPEKSLRTKWQSMWVQYSYVRLKKYVRSGRFKDFLYQNNSFT